MTSAARRRWRILGLAGANWCTTLVLAAIPQNGQPAPASDYVWDLPAGFPMPKVPDDNPMSVAKVALGRRLFFERRLSSDGTVSCATCHDPARAFTDGKARPAGVTGERHPRSSMSLANIVYTPVLTWGNPTVRRLEAQALLPLFGEHPVEMGLSGLEAKMLASLAAAPGYRDDFSRAFPGQADPISLHNMTAAIASFERTLISGRSPYDAYRNQQNPQAISASARRGEELFFDERTECFHCHGGFNFTETVDFAGKAIAEIEFFNTGLYNVDGKGRYPAPNEGVFSVSGVPADMGRFRAPTLRNIAVTAPYMHDGSIATLSGVIDHYAAGGRTIATGPRAGVGAANPHKSSFIKGFKLTAAEKRDLIAFLESLTDQTFLTDARFRDPGGIPTAASRPR
jgi:cytochrome c peroxidase